MVDFKKEIKLSDLRRKPKVAAGSPKPLKKTAAKSRKGKKQEIVGLKIGASQLAAARVVNNGSAKLMQVARGPLATGIVVGGEVRDVAALGEALDAFFTENNLPRKGVRIGIGTNRVGVRALDVEGIEDPKQLGNAVRFRAHEALSIPMDQAVLDYHVVSETADETGGITRRVVLAAAYREPVDHFVAACHAGGIELMGIDVEAFALLRAVAPKHVPSDEGSTAVVAVSLGHDRSTLAISDGTICDFTRVLEWGGAKIETAIGRDLGLTVDEAAELKVQLSLADDEADLDADPRHVRARASVRRELTALARELVASLQFYQSQPDSLAIGEILVTGGTTRMPGLVEELERLVRARVRVADPLVSVEDAGSVASRDDLGSLAVAIGLGVER
jgi:type IV pilus assembly protein PilM